MKALDESEDVTIVARSMGCITSYDPAKPSQLEPRLAHHALSSQTQMVG